MQIYSYIQKLHNLYDGLSLENDYRQPIVQIMQIFEFIIIIIFFFFFTAVVLPYGLK